MKKPKIVKVVVGLVIVGGITAGSIAFAKNNYKAQEIVPENTIVSTDTQFPSENIADISTESNAPTDGSLDINNTEKETDFVYDPMDFSKLEETTGVKEGVNEEVETEVKITPYEKLLKEREFYYNHLVEVINDSNNRTKEEISTAIYSIVRLDSDLSNLLVLMYNEKIKEVESMKYYADQIETLEYVLTEMKNLEVKINDAEKLYEKHLTKIGRANAERIKKVKKFAVVPLEAPIADLEGRVENLKVLLEDALNA